MNDIDSLYALAGLREDGPRSLCGVAFVSKEFERVLVGPGVPPEATVLLKDCAFTRCTVRGEFRIAQGVALDNVLFDEIRASDVMIFSAQAVLNRVCVKGGRRSAGLWVRPSEFTTPALRETYQAWAATGQSTASWMLDFSELESTEVEVLGLPLKKLRWNSERHVPLRLASFKSDKWKELNFPATSFWRLRLKRLELFGVTEAVFSLPVESDKKFIQTKDEMRRLIDAGIL